jgi:transposase
MQDARLFPGMDVSNPINFSSLDASVRLMDPPRLRRPDRRQVLMEPCCLEDRLPTDHPARTIWAVVEKLDLSPFYAAITARGSDPGRSATDPRLLVALWLFAATEGLGNGRELDRLCREHDAYRWLCGGVSLNYHTLNDFRVAHETALDDLFTKVLATLMHHKVVTVTRISQDGTRVRASAGVGSFRSRATLEKRLQEAKAHVEALKKQGEESPAESARRQAARERGARERAGRLEAAIAELPKVEAAKAALRADKPSKKQSPRVSMTDPEARKMKMGNGGFNPAYNVQLAVDTESRAIVAVEVANEGTDNRQSEPLRQQVAQRTGGPVKEHLLDGGYWNLEVIERTETSGVQVYLPVHPNQTQSGKRKKGGPGVTAWRNRMETAEGKSIYRQRAATSETVNADLKTYRGLLGFGVRGLAKVRCVALWSALAYNVLRFAEVLMT